MDLPGGMWPWVMLALMGAFHGLNPAMGWLFAVSLGFQERRIAAVARALGPIALGHLLAIAAMVLPVALLQIVIPSRVIMVLGGTAMVAYAGYKVAIRFRHPRWVGMRVTSRELISWSALMAAAHGAGLMLIPALSVLRHDSSAAATSEMAMAGSKSGEHAHHMQMLMTSNESGPTLLSALMAISLHAFAMLLMMGTIALLVYRWIGVGILRRAWINLDLLWTGSLAIAGGITLTIGLWSLR